MSGGIIGSGSDSSKADVVMTTKGDVATYSSSRARLGIGVNDTVFTADSTQTTGNKWSHPDQVQPKRIAGSSLQFRTPTSPHRFRFPRHRSFHRLHRNRPCHLHGSRPRSKYPAPWGMPI